MRRCSHDSRTVIFPLYKILQILDRVYSFGVVHPHFPGLDLLEEVVPVDGGLLLFETGVEDLKSHVLVEEESLVVLADCGEGYLLHFVDEILRAAKLKSHYLADCNSKLHREAISSNTLTSMHTCSHTCRVICQLAYQLDAKGFALHHMMYGNVTEIVNPVLREGTIYVVYIDFGGRVLNLAPDFTSCRWVLGIHVSVVLHIFKCELWRVEVV